MAEKKAKWLELGVLIRNTTKRDGTVIPVEEQKTYLKLSDEAHAALSKAGFNVGKNGVLINPVDEVESLFKNGFIEEGKIEERRETARNASSWLKYKIQVPPPKA